MSDESAVLLTPPPRRPLANIMSAERSARLTALGRERQQQIVSFNAWWLVTKLEFMQAYRAPLPAWFVGMRVR